MDLQSVSPYLIAIIFLYTKCDTYMKRLEYTTPSFEVVGIVPVQFLAQSGISGISDRPHINDRGQLPKIFDDPEGF